MRNTPVKQEGDELRAVEFSSGNSELKNLVTTSGQVLSAGDNTQISKAVAHYVGNGGFYLASGGANAYILTPIGTNVGPPAYVDGMRVAFRIGAESTGAVTVNVAGLGVKNVRGTSDGTFRAGEIADLVYGTSINGFINVSPPVAVGYNMVDNPDLEINDRNFNGNYSALQANAFGHNRWQRSGSPAERQQYIREEYITIGSHTLSWTGGGIGSIQGIPNLTSPAIVELTPNIGNALLILPTGAGRVRLVKGTVADTLGRRNEREERLICADVYRRQVLSGQHQSFGIIGHYLDNRNVTFTGMISPPMRTVPTMDVVGAYARRVSTEAEILTNPDFDNEVVSAHAFTFTLTIPNQQHSLYQLSTAYQLAVRATNAYLEFDAELTST